jgi:hypothetical protein
MPIKPQSFRRVRPKGNAVEKVLAQSEMRAHAEELLDKADAFAVLVVYEKEGQQLSGSCIHASGKTAEHLAEVLSVRSRELLFAHMLGMQGREIDERQGM